MTATTIVVDALSVHMGGGLSYLSQQLAALGDVAPQRELLVVTAPWNHGELATATGLRPIRIPVRGLTSRVLYEQLILPRRRPDDAVLYCPGNLMPLVGGHLPTVLALQNPNLVGIGPEQRHNRRPRRRLQIAVARRSLQRADRVVVISEALRDQVMLDDVVPADRLRVVPSGRQAPAGHEVPVTPDGFPFAADEFFLVLANDAPHKHHDDTIMGWAAAFGGRSDPPGLVIAGRMSEARQAEQRALLPEPLRSQLVHLGPIEDRRQVSWLLRHARALVAMSTLEAHPLTPAEAGRVGCPLVLSDIAAHREVAGRHARYVGVGDTGALADELSRLPPGSARTTWEWPVTWHDNARRLLDVFDELVS